jgi:hypothetical protein
LNALAFNGDTLDFVMANENLSAAAELQDPILQKNCWKKIRLINP